MEVRCLEIFEYAELVHLASQQTQVEDGKGCEVLERFMGAMGPAGSGLVGVRGVPSLLSSRPALLPLARFLALLPPLQRSNLLTEQGLGTDVSFKDPDRLVSSFAAQLSFGQEQKHGHMVSTDDAANPLQEKQEDSNTTQHRMNDGLMENELHQLGSLFRQLGKAMVEVGLLVARICDMAIPGAGLEEAILQACTAKGRLIHYHSLVDGLFLRAISSCASSKASKGRKSNQFRIDYSTTETSSCKDMWQEWHFDYGIFTALTVPMFLSMCEMDVSCLDHLVSPEFKASFLSNKAELDALYRHIGLKILNSGNGHVEYVSVPADCLIIQVGEAAQILTGGKLRATAHCVCRPRERHDISRETFVVFLQPAWHRRLFLPSPVIDLTVVQGHDMKDLGPNTVSTFEKDFQDIHSKIPVLESRWKNGSTFAEFSRETTKKYYGANGAQQSRT